jgi:two-component system, sensor histidine kinase LadS
VLKLRENFPRAGRMIYFAAGVYIFSAMAAMVGFYHWVAVYMFWVALLVTIVNAFVCVWLIWRGNHYLLLYAIAFSIQLLTGLAVMLRNLGILTVDFSLEQLGLFTTTLHIVLLNWALAERLRHGQREKIALEKASAKLQVEQQIMDQQRQFMVMMTHEFRTPLTIIDTSAQRIVGNLQQGPDKLRERSHNILDATRRMTSLMDSLLAFDRVEGDLRIFKLKKCSPDMIFKPVLAEYGNNRIEVQLFDLPDEVFVDVALLRVALSNLFSNAIRYSEPHKRIRFFARGLPDNGIEFSVSDEGPGIPVDEITKIFERYYRGRGVQTKPGTGLGLFLLKQIVDIHGGTVNVESTPGKGSCFTMTLPGKQNAEGGGRSGG